ncbi:MAG: hypothetical protein ACI8ZX_002679 [Planctomycetota bacterium]|jgi:uncharacterized protein (DUF2147 family)
MKKSIISIILFLFLTITSFAQSEVEGIWFNTKKDGKIKIYEKDGKFYGEIVWLLEPLDKNDGKPKRDIYNPDEAKHSDLIIGLNVLKGLEFDTKNVWDSGKIYDPENGKTYACKMTLVDENHLDVRGFVGFSLLGRTENWTRAK